MKKRMCSRIVAVWLSIMMMFQMAQSAMIPVFAEEMESEPEIAQEVTDVEETTEEPEIIAEEAPAVEETPLEEILLVENTEEHVEDVQDTFFEVEGVTVEPEESVVEQGIEETPETVEEAFDETEETIEEGESVEADEILEEKAEPTSYALAESITSIEIAEGYTVVMDGDVLTAKFGWQVSGSVNGATDTFFYQLPEEFYVENGISGVVTKGEHGEVIGTYHVSADGLVTVNYHNTYVAESQTVQNYMEISGTAKCTEETKEIRFTWKNGVKTVEVASMAFLFMGVMNTMDVTEVSHQLADHIKSLEIIGNPESVARGEKVTVKLGWLIEGEVHGGTDSFTYQLPVNFKMEHASTGPITKGEGGESIGTYHVNTDGLVTITYNADYNTNKQTTINFMEITGDAQYGEEKDAHKIKFEWKTGSKIVVVTNPGDFTVKKRAVRNYPNDTLGHSSTIEYTVDIESELGTGEPITINDTLIPTGFLEGDSFTFDLSSFKLVDANQNEISVSPIINGKKFTIENIPALPSGGSYKLTYTVNVQQSGNLKANPAKVQNTVVVKSGENTHQDTRTVEYGMVLNKYGVEYNNAQRTYRWGTTIRTNGTNLAGFTFTDTADAPLAFDADGKPRISITALKADGTNISFTWPAITISEDKKTFSFVIPDAPGATSWAIGYYTTVEGDTGTSFVINNKAELKYVDVWTSGAVGKGTIQGTTTVNKVGGGFGEKNQDGIVSVKWTNTITYDENVIKDYYEHTDKIEYAGFRYFNGSYAGWDYKTYKNDHYGIASEIYQQIVDTLRVTVMSEDGQEQVLNYAQANQWGKVEIGFMTSENPDSKYTVSNANSTSKVKSFQVRISHMKPVKVEYSYSTRFDTKHYSNGTLWVLKNSLGAETKWSTPTQEYRQETGTVGGEIHKQLNLWSEVWTSSDYTLNYYQSSANGSEQSARVLKFRLLVSTAEGADTLYVTDHLPEGLTLVEDSVRVGNYDRNSNKMSANWTSNNNVSVAYDAATRILSVSVSDIGKSLKLKDDNNVVIEYRTNIDDNFEEGAVITSENGAYRATRDFTNVASNGENSDSLKVTVYKEQKVLEKTGTQIQENGANTKRVHYTVQINPDGLDLIPGSDVLTLTDTLKSDALDFDLDPESVRLTTKNGSIVELPGLQIQDPIQEGNTRSQTFTVTVQDSTAYVLEYDFIADKREATSAATSGNFENTIALEGYASDEDNTSVKGINVRASSNHAGLQLVKVDTNNHAKFLTASFDLFKYNGSEYERMDTITLSGKEGLTFDYYSQNCALEGNVLYKVVEKTAPEGYELDETPFYFIIKGNIQDVRSHSIDATNLVIASDEDAKIAANAPAGLEIHMLNPNTGSHFKIGNKKAPASVKVQFEAEKSMIGKELSGNDFSFTVKEGETVVATGQNDKEGKIIFGEIEYKKDDVGTHLYTIAEVNDGQSGIVYDTSTYNVTVEVTEDEDENLHADVTYPSEDGVKFENRYDTKSVYLNLEAKKELTGRGLKDGEFSFAVSENGKTVATGKNNKDGEITFTQIEYKLADVGTHTLTVTEVAGNQGGVEYSKESYTLTVTVTDNGDGTLKLEVTKPKNGIVFHNGYHAAEAIVSLGAKKSFPGGTLKDGMFTFELKDSNGTVVDRVRNTADGNISFRTLHFKEAGEYIYTVSEVIGYETRVAYDRTVYTVKITVKDDEEGKLVASVDLGGQELVFVNHYAPAIPNTAASSANTQNRDLICSILTSLALAMLAALLSRKKNTSEE